MGYARRPFALASEIAWLYNGHVATTPQTVEASGAESISAWTERIALGAVTVVLAGVLVAFAAYLLFAIGWLQLPFLGAMVEHTLVFNDLGPSREGSWETYSQEIRFGDQLIAIDGQTVASSVELEAWLSKARSGQPVELTVRAYNGELRAVQTHLQGFPRVDFVTYFVVPYLIGLVFLLTGLWVFGLRRKQAVGQAFAVFAASGAVVLGGLFDLSTTHRLTRLWTLALAAAPGALVTLALLFPSPLHERKRWSRLPWLALASGVVLGLAAQMQLYDRLQSIRYLHWWRTDYLTAAIGVLVFFGLMVYRRILADSPIVREQARVVLIGTASAFGPMAAWLLLATLRPAFSLNQRWSLTPLFLLPLAMAYAVLRHRLLNTDYLLSRGLLYATLGILTTVGYSLLVSGMSLVLGARLRADNPLLIGVMVFIVAVAFAPVRSKLESWIDELFFRGARAYRDRVQLLGRQLTQAIDLPDITARLREHVESALNPTHLHIFVLDTVSQTYVAVPDERGPTTDLRFPGDAGLPQFIGRTRAALYLDSGSSLPAPLNRDRARLAVLGSVVYVPISTKDRLAGWLALGPRRSREPYSRNDLSFLESIADQSSLAIARAQVVVDLERRLNELDVLSRVAQAVNFTQSYDDLLELIYTQTNHVIPAREFRIGLFEERSKVLKYAFLLEDNERIFDREGQPVPRGVGLLPEVAESGLPLRVDDYTAACADRGVQVDATFRAWMGVPLNAGASTLGAIGLGSTEPGLAYTDEQMKILWAIADQAAGALVKASLYQEAEERARQLATLNEVASTLANTLEVDPLLHRILTSAVDLLECEAGSLILVDETTGELVFRVTAGPVASELAGRRMPPGAGLVGQSVDRGEALIVDDVHATPDWFRETDAETGFSTAGLMVVPLQARDQVIGAIEVVNKRSGVRFDDDDLALLSAFAAQAAIAIANATLYSITDEALAARVEELSIMQRIDRELNVGLDLDRALTITLGWAIRYTNADSGLLALGHEGELVVMGALGYPSGYEPSPLQPVPPELGGLKEVMHTVEPLNVDDVTTASEVRGLDPGTRAIVALPIVREERALGALLLESHTRGAFEADHVSFLARLADHASIAITNARLYAQVQEANLAKSEFVSFVSHELKTPMTSIRGYTDLIVKGTVGPVTETQTNFLETIRSNVDRMSSLVSDLTDISRIESGRLRLEFEAVALDKLIAEVVRSSQERIDTKKQSLRLNLPQNLPPAWGDPNRLIQIVANLVSNANKYTAEGGEIELSVEVSDNRWNPNGAPRVLHLAVWDTGVGISPEDQLHIFEKFFRSENPAVRESPGTGLGLSISKYLVELQGGSIWFESGLDKGTVFHFTVPVADEVAEAVPAHEADTIISRRRKDEPPSTP